MERFSWILPLFSTEPFIIFSLGNISEQYGSKQVFERTQLQDSFPKRENVFDTAKTTI